MNTPLVIRPAISSDILQVVALDHNYATDFVWQMEFRTEDRNTSIQFRQVRLPRSAQIVPARTPKPLLDSWTRHLLFIVAETEGEVVGYLALAEGNLPKTAIVADFCIERSSRRQGLGSKLMTAALEWAGRNQVERVLAETQSKNHPAISFLQVHGFAFCGFNDGYYPNRDIALFFCRELKNV